MNIKLLREVKRAILASPKQFVMGAFYDTDTTLRDGFDPKYAEDDLPRAIPKCGTAACIAGWALALDHRLDPRQAFNAFGDDVMPKAQSALGIDSRAGRKLFVVASWPKTFYDEWRATQSIPKRAKIAAARIDHFIRTRGKE